MCSNERERSRRVFFFFARSAARTFDFSPIVEEIGPFPALPVVSPVVSASTSSVSHPDLGVRASHRERKDTRNENERVLVSLKRKRDASETRHREA